MLPVSHKYAKVWKIMRPKKEDAKYYLVKLGTSEKNCDGEYENSQWMCRAIGHAYNQVKSGEIEENETYAFCGKQTNIPYQDDEGEWHDNNLRTLVTDFGEAGTEMSIFDKKNSESKPKGKGSTSKKKSAPPPAETETEEDPW